jgi:hypothetical protein
MKTNDYWGKTSLPVDDEPEVAKATLKLFEKYGFDVPKEEWDRALRGATGFEEKVFCSDDLSDDDEPPPPKPSQTTNIKLIPGKVTDVLFSVTKDELLKLDRYYFAPIQTKTSAVDRKLRASRTLPKQNIRKLLTHHFYATASTDLPEDFDVYHNAELKCVVVVYSPTNHYWFLQP